MNPPATDLELVDALAQRLRGLPSPPSQPFTVHDNIYIFNDNPSYLYDMYGGGEDCVYFFCNPAFSNQDGWKVAAGTQGILDGGGGAVMGWKHTLVFHESRWLPRIRWAMDEFVANYQEAFKLSSDSMRLYRLHRPA
ncbi:unnamed protein product [Urochloa decumbens]|uniref:NAC domain-containing protein n=1 Tax=Urochloa decumbens TaxID=240449 RepID=A0ABC9BLV5_9POAL